MARKKHCRYGVVSRGRRKGRCLKHKRSRRSRRSAIARSAYGRGSGHMWR